MNVFTSLLSLVSHIRVRETDVTLTNKVLLFLMKLKLGVTFLHLVFSLVFTEQQPLLSSI